MDIYAQNILDRYKKPYYGGLLVQSATVNHKEANHSCGDVVEISIQFQNDKATDYGFEGSGCAISMAAADMIGDLIEGMDKDEIIKLAKEEIYKMLGIEISIRRSKCALLSLLAIQNALLKEPKSWSDYLI